MNEISKEVLISLYSSLRSEIHQRLDQRQQLLTYTLIGAASFFTISLQSWASAVTVLCYGPLSFFLACAWGQHNNRISQITVYLSALEARFIETVKGWEQYRQDLWKSGRRLLSSSVHVPAQGLFLGSQLLSLVIGFARFLDSPSMALVFVGFFVADLGALCATALVLKSKQAVSPLSIDLEERP